MKHARPDYQGRIVDLADLIPADEPVFFVRGQDKAGPATLRAWAAKAEELGADHEIVNLVRRQAYAMEEWQESRAAKVPDLPARPPIDAQ